MTIGRKKCIILTLGALICTLIITIIVLAAIGIFSSDHKTTTITTTSMTMETTTASMTAETTIASMTTETTTTSTTTMTTTAMPTGLEAHIVRSLNNISVYPEGSYLARISSFSSAPTSSALLPLNRSTLEQIGRIDHSSLLFEAGRQQFLFFRISPKYYIPSTKMSMSSTESNAMSAIAIRFRNKNSDMDDLVTVIPLSAPNVKVVHIMTDGSTIVRIQLNSSASLCSPDVKVSSNECVMVNYDARTVINNNQISSPISNDAYVACGDVCSLTSTQCSASCAICNDEQVAGADTPISRRYKIDSEATFFKFDYSTHTIKDRIKVWDGAELLFDSGCVGKKETLKFSYPNASSNIRVDVEPNCECRNPYGCTGTAWDFIVHCPILCDINAENETSNIFLQSGNQQVSNNTVLYIGKNAIMPPLLAGSCMNDTTVVWSVNFTYRASISQPFDFSSVIIDGESSLNSPFDIRAMLRKSVYGGFVLVGWMYGEQFGEFNFTILGTEPDKDDLMKYIDSHTRLWYAKKIAKIESDGGNQFETNGSGWPLVSDDNRYGIYQLTTNPPPEYSQLFNWKENVNEGIRRLTLMQTDAINWIIEQRRHANGEPIPDETIGNCYFNDGNITDAVAIQMYNDADLGKYISWNDTNKQWEFNRANNATRKYVQDVCNQTD